MTGPVRANRVRGWVVAGSQPATPTADSARMADVLVRESIAP